MVANGDIRAFIHNHVLATSICFLPNKAGIYLMLPAKIVRPMSPKKTVTTRPASR